WGGLEMASGIIEETQPCCRVLFNSDRSYGIGNGDTPYAYQSHPGSLLERCYQRRCGRPGHGHHDDHYRSTKNHGQVCRCGLVEIARLDLHCRHGGFCVWNDHRLAGLRIAFAAAAFAMTQTPKERALVSWDQGSNLVLSYVLDATTHCPLL